MNKADKILEDGGFREVNLQVLNPGEVYLLGTPKLGVLMESKLLTVNITHKQVSADFETTTSQGGSKE